jgi:hypothetical protein
MICFVIARATKQSRTVYARWIAARLRRSQ